MLYAYTRISSISRKANLDAKAIAEARRTTPVALEHDKELKLGKLLLRFPEVILKVADDLCLGRRCIPLSQQFPQLMPNICWEITFYWVQLMYMYDAI